MFVFLRLYRFHRRSGASRRRAIQRAWAAVRRDYRMTMRNLP
jgi:cation transport regulator ChaB